ncbi:uncharacterized protein PV09_08746 [Verruconis gallopava]|uniref:Glycosyltransferase 2 n=1 Tax=Verruconis gallopava TaxID=253628 RepID=A0A0D2AKN6_9PEZI|nr:uncharacterized protein PV09_08746 [Verruconis gallopava]KIV99568.1 hypothetical protein PV09_08746 [Verruconis gallopava]
MVRGGAGGFNAHRLFADFDEDLQAVGKKDDDRKVPSGAGGGPAAAWVGSVGMGRLRSRRRIALIACAVLAVWLFLRNIPAEFWEPNETGAMRIAKFHSGTDHAGFRPVENTQPKADAALAEGRTSPGQAASGLQPPPRSKGKKAKEDTYYYDGPIVFPNLKETLRGIQRTMGFRRVNQNVLFVASSLKSLSTIIPLACEMTRHKDNFVHVAVLGRSDLDVEEIVRINGVDADECKVFWHDARPNYASYSSEVRAEASVASAMEHIQEYMHPQVVIMDDSSLEDPWLTRQVRTKSAKHGWPVIELPAGASERLHWLARLDAQALRAFHKTRVDIVVQAPQKETGGLLRLLRSLSQADYRGLPVPKLTIELPPEVDDVLRWYVSDYKWPPSTSPLQPVLSSQLNLRHRIPGQRLKPEEASIRFLESFYPTSAEHSHVLVLNNNVELSPLFYHWLMYYILHYKFSRLGSSFSSNLVGLSLEIPNTHLNGTSHFDPPNLKSNVLSTLWPGRTNPRSPDTSPPFLWQSPGSNAALYFGDRWVEIHDFLKHRLPSVDRTQKIIGEHLPAWTEYVLEIMRARGWEMLYPPTIQGESTMATLHTELWKPPEEFALDYKRALAKEKSKENGGDGDGEDVVVEEEPSSLGDKGSLSAHPAHWEQSEGSVIQTQQPLHSVLPFRGEEPLLRSLPHLLYDGESVQWSEMPAIAEEYAESFRKTLGGCSDETRKASSKIVPHKAGDLFCQGDEGEDGREKPAKPGKPETPAKVHHSMDDVK